MLAMLGKLLFGFSEQLRIASSVQISSRYIGATTNGSFRESINGRASVGGPVTRWAGLAVNRSVAAVGGVGGALSGLR